MTIRQLYGMVFSEDSDLCRLLKHTCLWHLSQARHLIVHRRGVVDEKYLKQTDSKLNRDQRLVVTGYDVKAYAEYAFDLVNHLLPACRTIGVAVTEGGLREEPE
jgi:hypothetical protein